MLSDCAVITSAGNTGNLLSGLQRSPEESMRYDDFFLNGEPRFFGKIDLPRIVDYTVCSRTCAFLRYLVDELSDTVDRFRRTYRSDRLAIIIGTTTTGIREVEAQSNLQNIQYHEQQELAAVSAYVADYCGFSGPNIVVSTACTSGAKALTMAQNLIQSGWCDAAIAGAAESLNRLACQGFDSLDSYASGYSKPFQANRDGITIGEGGALFAMEKGKSGVTILGAAETTDAWHETAPDPEGTHASHAIISALNVAGMQPCEVDYVNLHGTGTKLNDAMESKVVNEIFGNQIASSSTKPVTGHTLAAAGAVEAAIGWLLLTSNEQVHLPPHHGAENYDPDLAKIKLIDKENNPPCIINSVLSTSFAFGGHNIALLLSNVGGK